MLEIRSTPFIEFNKGEIRNKSETLNMNDQNIGKKSVLNFYHSDFGFVSDFGFRISCFRFVTLCDVPIGC